MPEWLKAPLLRLLRVPAEPAPPAGAAGSLLVFRAAPGYFLYKTTAWLLRQVMTLVGIAVALFFFWQGARGGESGIGKLFLGLELLAVLFVLLGIPFSLLLLRLDYEMRWYLVTDRSLRIREGAWGVREMTMTFANVQNVEVSQGPLQRLFGIADLRVQTAGGGGSAPANQQGQEGLGLNMHVGWLRGIANAPQVRDQIVSRLRRYRDAGLGDPDSPAPVAEPAAADAPPLEEVVRGLAAEAAGLRVAAQALASRRG